MVQTKKNLAVAIIFFEKVDQTIDCIKSIVTAPVNIYILNNASSKKSFKVLKQRVLAFDNIEFFDSKINLGPARGRNKLISLINEEWIFFLDNDIIVKNLNWYNVVNSHILKNDGIEVFIPRLFNVHENKWINYHKYLLNNNTIEGAVPINEETNCFPGGASVVNRALFKRVGLYNDEITVLEDFELSIKALIKLEPIKAKLINDIELFHFHKYSKIKKDKAATRIRYAHTQYKFAENFIQNKYKVVYYSGWEKWVNEQINLMIEPTIYQKINTKITKILRIIKRKLL